MYVCMYVCLYVYMYVWIGECKATWFCGDDLIAIGDGLQQLADPVGELRTHDDVELGEPSGEDLSLLQTRERPDNCW